MLPLTVLPAAPLLQPRGGGHTGLEFDTKIKDASLPEEAAPRRPFAA